MKVICSWCGKTIEESDDNAEADSHGICDSCKTKFVVRATLRQLKGVAETVNTQVVITCDDKTQEKLITSGINRHLETQVGELLQCKNVTLDDGCGTTRFCGKCKLREVMESALASGKAYEHILIPFENIEKENSLFISIHRIGSHLEMVLHDS